ncbi:WD40-repeat protein [Oleiphilus messinensis]|uniref:WD40-repeat protein n=1 Tax=Oleiphilus messinensis TaxID=141451 RepID=A0A1Y0I340_9GAMM|nr:hypothetical protein [Oleiphilus messinensis]ARU54206.1 WD40-repeat protein [Oleiphilus messinensis]
MYLLKRSLYICSALLFSAFLTGCDSGSPPAKSWKYAAQGILSADLSGESEKAVIGSIHHGGSLWDTQKGERLFNWNHKAGEYSTFRAVALSGDGKVACTTEHDALGVWNADTGESLAFWRAPDKVLALSVSDTGRYALMSLPNNTVSYFDLKIGQGLFLFDHDAPVWSLDFSAEANRAITGSDDMIARVWDLSNGQLLHQFEHKNQIKSVAISPDGRYGFSAAQREDTIIWDLNSGKVKRKLDFRYVNFTAARFSERGDKLLLGTFQGQLHLIDVNSGKTLKTWHSKPRQFWGASASKAIMSVGFGRGNTYYGLSSDGIMGLYK